MMRLLRDGVAAVTVVITGDGGSTAVSSVSAASLQRTLEERLI
jgi:hypothetical protein